MTEERPRLALEPIGGDPEIGRWLAALEEIRRDTLEVVAHLPADAVDVPPPDGGDTVGTVLYHVALVEVDWVFTDVLGPESGREISTDVFPFDARTGDHRLTPVRGESIDQHLERLAATRRLILDVLGAMSSEEYHRPRSGTELDVAADWVVLHLIDHEVEHRVRLTELRDAFAAT